MTKARKLVSVLIPTYGRPLMLQHALDSVFAQSYPAACIEIIIVHDGKNDLKTSQLLDNASAISERLQYLTIEKRGLSAAINAAFEHSRGDYVTVLADDDAMRPHKLELFATMLDDDLEVTGAYALGERALFNLNGTVREESRVLPERNLLWLRAHPIVDWGTIQKGDGCLIHGTATMHRRASWEKAGKWDEKLWAAEEWEYHLRLLSTGARFKGVESVTDTYRIHGGQKSICDRQGARATARRSLITSISEKYLALAKGA